MTFPSSIKGKRAVWGEGPHCPKFIIIGESLGAEEEEKGRPFIGTDGGILDGMLGSAGILRSECYITNVIKIRPPDNKVRRLGELGLRGEDFIPLLKEEIDGIDCKIIIALGNVALGATTNIGLPSSGDVCFTEGVGKRRGSIYDSDIFAGRVVIPTYNPGFVRELWQARGTVVADFRKAIRVQRGGREFVKFNTITRPSLRDVDDFCTAIEVGCEEFCLDIESYKKSKQISCVGLGATFPGMGRRMSICIPFKNGLLNYWEEGDEVWVWKRLQRLLQREGLMKVGQFINFDFTMLLPFVGEPSPPWFDLNVAHHTIDPELPHTLAYLTSIYTDIPYYKDDTKEEGVGMWSPQTPTERLWEYNGKDVEGPLIIKERLISNREWGGGLREERLEAFFYGYAMPKMRALWRVQNRGMLVDQRRRGVLAKWRGRQALRKQRELDGEIGHEINVNSPKQVMEFLYKELKLPIQYHRKSRKPTSNEETLQKLAGRYPNNKAFNLLMDLRGIYKEIGTYLVSEISEDGRCRTTYNSTGTETGRSSSKKTCYGDGMDLQNVPEELRGMFVAGEGKVYLKYDLWQAEAYVVAVLANCKPFLDRLLVGKKIYPMIGGWLYDKPEEDIDNNNKPGGEYFLAKRTSHASNYGLGPNLFATLIKRPLSDAKRLLAKYHSHAPEIGEWHRSTQEELKQSRRLVTPFGRIRYFRNRFGEDMFREAYAHTPQSTIGDYLHHALLKIEYAQREGIKILQEGFDSLVIECNEEIVKEVDHWVREMFVKRLLWRGNEFIIPVDGKRGMTWGKK